MHGDCPRLVVTAAPPGRGRDGDGAPRPPDERSSRACEIARVLETADAGLLDRLLTGSRAHARRREAEMGAAASLERDLGVEPHVAAAAANVLRAIRVDTI